MASIDTPAPETRPKATQDEEKRRLPRGNTKRVGLARVAALVFASGFGGLTLQVAWFREFGLVFGASTASSAAVLAIFMGGLGAGNALLGPTADRHRHPLRLYAHLVALIAASAMLSGPLIDLARSFYVFLGGQSVLGFAGATFVRLLLAMTVLALPAVLMGGTLPAAVKAVTARADRQRRAAAVLYGVNTLGAVVGALSATFLLLPLVGTRMTLWSACFAYLLAAVTCYWWLRRGLANGDRNEFARRSPARQSRPESIPAPARFVYAAAGISGFTFFLMEIVWYRMLGPILGGTTYTFGLILAIALLGIGLGGLLYPVLVRRLRVSLSVFAASCALQAAFMTLPLALGDRVALWAAELNSFDVRFLGAVFGWTSITCLVVLPAATLGGFQFPLLIALAGAGDDEIGSQVGRTFAANTFGAIAGSLAGGFGILPLMTAPGAWRAAVLVLLALALSAGVVAWRNKQRRVHLLVPGGAVALTLLLLAAPGPTAVWRHSGIGAGRFRLPDRGSAEMQDWINGRRRAVLWEAEGIEASVALLAQDGLAFSINGKTDGHAVKDAGTQIMLGLLGAALHRAPETALVVGLGTGETPGWLAEVATLRRVDVVELEPAIAEMARRCAAVNHDAMNHPKIRLIYNDAREVLLTAPEGYDLIVSEPSNPYRAGIANLFTQEFYRAARDRLHEEGLFVQWLQGYEVDAETVATTLATLRSVFDHVEIWQSKAEDMLLVCSRRPISLDAEGLSARISEEPWRSALKYAWRTTDLAGFLARHVAGPKLVQQIARKPHAQVNTDDRNWIEYGFARTLGRQSTGFSIDDLRAKARAIGAHRPRVSAAAVDWRRVEDHRQLMLALADGRVRVPPDATPTQLARTEVLRQYWSGNAAAMLAEWRKAGYEPLFPTETALLALAGAHAGSNRAKPLIKQLETFNVLEARAIEAHLLCQQAEFAAAAAKLEAVFLGLREAPWCLSHVLELVFPSALKVAARKPEEAGRLFAAMGRPFAVYLHEEKRLATAHAVAALVGPEAALQILQVYEPHVPWTQRFLENRFRVYQAANHPLASRARTDWESCANAERRRKSALSIP